MIKFNHKLAADAEKRPPHVRTQRFLAALAVFSASGLSVLSPPSTFAQTPMPVAAQSPQAAAKVFTFGKPPKGLSGISVESPAPYDQALGYGFISIPNGNETAFSVRVVPGDYLVTATLGDDKAASRTSIWAKTAA